MGTPVVPEENMTKRGWLKGSCSNSMLESSPKVWACRKSSMNTLEVKRHAFYFGTP